MRGFVMPRARCSRLWGTDTDMSSELKDWEKAARLLAAAERRPPKTVESMAAAFRADCQDGGTDFLNYLRPWHMQDALETINEAANGSLTPEAALGIIREALGELVATAVVGHREAVEWEGVE